MSDQTEKVFCEKHGESYATFVCKHLARGINKGFYCSSDSSDPKPDAWCFQCDRLMLEQGEWTEELEQFAQITLLCANCYDIVKQRNEVNKPSIDYDGWELESALERHLKYPDTFGIPSDDKRNNIEIGELVQLLFLILGEGEKGEYIQCEKMWVTVKEKTKQGYIGVLESFPVTSDVLNPGDYIEFEPHHICSIVVKEEEG